MTLLVLLITNQKNIMTKKTKIITAVLIVVVVIIAVFGFRKSGPTTKPVVTIGITLPLTGDVAMLGQANKKAILLSESQLPKNLKYDYKLVFEDDQFKPAMGATIANKLISIDKASALISFGSPVGNIVSPIAEKNKIAHINDFASDPNVASGEYNYVDYTPAYQDSKVFIAELIKRNIKTLVFFGQQDNPGATALIQTFLHDASNTPEIKILSTQLFNTGTRDFRTEISKVKGLNPDIYVLEASSPEIETVTRQLRQAGIKTPVTTMEAFEFSPELSLFEGMWYVNAADPMPWFVDLYTKTYGEYPKFGAANGYDSLNLLIQAVENAGDGKAVPSRVDIAKALSETKKFDGALGKGLTIGKDHLVISNAVIRIIKNGIPMTVSQ